MNNQTGNSLSTVYRELFIPSILIPTAVFLFILAWLFGMTGIILGLALIAFYFIPIYCLLSSLSSSYPMTDHAEKIFLSLFLSLGIIPPFTYYLGFLFSNLLLGLILTSLLLLTLSIFVSRFVHRHSQTGEPHG